MKSALLWVSLTVSITLPLCKSSPAMRAVNGDLLLRRATEGGSGTHLERTNMAPFYEGICQGHGPGAVEGVAALVGVTVVRPAAWSRLTVVRAKG